MKTIIISADGWHGISSADDELVVLALVVHSLWLSQHHSLEI